MAEEKIKVVFLLGTLKRSGEFSHTEALAEYVAEEFGKYNAESEIIRLADKKFVPGTKTRMDEPDDWPAVLERVKAADIIVFATPIWWGGHSSLIQRVFERLDELNDEFLATGRSDLDNKVGAVIVTGGEDGVQHVVGNVTNFMSWNGLSVAPACSVSWVGDASKDDKESLKKKFAASSTKGMTETCARNAAHLARLLKREGYPVKAK